MYRNKGKFHFESLERSDLDDILLCRILAMYEYLANEDGVPAEDWFHSFDGLCCPKEENEIYEELKKSPFNPDAADEIFENMLENSIEPFKSRGIPSSYFDFSV